MSGIYEAFMDEIKKIGIAGKPFSRIWPKTNAITDAVLREHGGDPKRLAQARETENLRHGFRANVAESLKASRKQKGFSVARAQLAGIRASAPLFKNLDRKMRRTGGLDPEKLQKSVERIGKIEDRALFQQAEKEMARAAKKNK